MLDFSEVLNLMGKKGFRRTFEILNIDKEIVNDNFEISSISFNTFNKCLDNHNLFLRDIRDILLKHKLIEIYRKIPNRKRYIRLTEKGVELKQTIEYLSSKFFGDS